MAVVSLLLIGSAFMGGYGSILDIVLLVSFLAICNWEESQKFFNLFNLAVVNISIIIASLIFGFFQIFRHITILNTPSSPIHFRAKPMLFPCRTNHTRFFPVKHSFSYSYLQVGVPVGWKGSVGGMVSVDVEKNLRPWYSRLFSLSGGEAWHTVNGDDYLARGHSEDGLQGKLRAYLESQDQSPSAYPFAYLLTAPRFLGYSSNPVSVWNLYSSTGSLSALILEVNNTFDERHIYFVTPSPSATSVPPLSLPTPPLPEKNSRFTQTIPKDFYVSVFNSRAGSYSLSATDPLSLSPTTPPILPIDTTITLLSSSSHPKLIARLASTSPPLDPSTMTTFQKTFFLASWWWVGFATFPRTVAQAGTLFLTKGLSWVFRPEPRKDTIPRQPNHFEQFLEPLFRDYMKQQVEGSEHTIAIRLITPSGASTFQSPSAQLGGEVEEFELRILTPLFYSRFIHYSCSTISAIKMECHSETISLVPCLFSSASSAITSLFHPLPKVSPPPSASWKLSLLPLLRRTTVPILCAQEPKAPISEKEIRLIRAEETTHPPFEAFILSFSPAAQGQYVSEAFRLFVSEYIAFGMVDLLELEVLFGKCAVFGMLAMWAGR